MGQGGFYSLLVEPIAIDLEVLEKADEFLPEVIDQFVHIFVDFEIKVLFPGG